MPEDTETVVRRRAGRPTQAERAGREEYLLETATGLFMDRGFDGTTMEAVAAAAGVSKRTLYVRYPDKTRLFAAALRREIDRVLEPLARIEASSDNLEEYLVSVGLQLATRSQSLVSVTLFRIMSSQAAQFPEIPRLVSEVGRDPIKRKVAAVLARHATHLRTADLDAAADIYVALTTDSVLAQAMMGIVTPPDRMEAHIRAVLDVFLRGVLRR